MRIAVFGVESSYRFFAIYLNKVSMPMADFLRNFGIDFGFCGLKSRKRKPMR